MPTVGVEFAKVSYTPAGGHLVLRDVSVALDAGTTTALLGRSGSGKTTLLRSVNGLVRPSSGDVIVNGQSVGALQTEKELVALRRGIGYVIQETGLFPHMTVERNASLALELEGRPKEESAARAREDDRNGWPRLRALFASAFRGNSPEARGRGSAWQGHWHLIRQYC